MQSAVVCLINRQRRAHGLPALRASSELDRSAQGWTDAMVSRRDFTHGADFSARITAVGFRWSNAGENIATGFETPRAVVAAWMASMDTAGTFSARPSVRSARESATTRSPGRAPCRGTWTQDFGLLMNQHPVSGNWAAADGCPYG